MEILAATFHQIDAMREHARNYDLENTPLEEDP
jgi:hypothetical protein